MFTKNKRLSSQIASFFHYNLNLGYFYINGSIKAGGRLKTEVTLAGKTLTRTVKITKPSTSFRDIANRDESDCFAFNYDVLENRTSHITRQGNTFHVSGLYNAWSMSFTNDEHLANNLVTKADDADRFSVKRNSCKTDYFRGSDRSNKHFMGHVFWFDLRCIDYVGRGIDNHTAEETTALSNPICSSNASENGGDGWGWENGASCVEIMVTPFYC